MSRLTTISCAFTVVMATAATSAADSPAPGAAGARGKLSAQRVLSKLKARHLDPRQLRFETIQNDGRSLSLRLYHQRSFAGKLEVGRRDREARITFIGVDHRLHGKGLGLALVLVAAQWAHDRGMRLAKSADTTHAADSLWQRLRRSGLAEQLPRPAQNWTPNPESDGAYLRFKPGALGNDSYRPLFDLLRTQPVPPGAPWATEPQWRFSSAEFFRSGGPSIPTWATGEVPAT